MILMEIIVQVEQFHQKGLISGNISINDIFVIQTVQKCMISVDPNVFKQREPSVANKNTMKLFSSVNSDKQKELKFKDDLESLGYLAVYLLTGTLPWKKY
jgi:uncharacterized protein YabN with tetrapyrrole methylase and pyrophosphatase domain